MSHQSLRSPEASRERAGGWREERGAGFRKRGVGGGACCQGTGKAESASFLSRRSAVDRLLMLTHLYGGRAACKLSTDHGPPACLPARPPARHLGVVARPLAGRPGWPYLISSSLSFSTSGFSSSFSASFSFSFSSFSSWLLRGICCCCCCCCRAPGEGGGRWGREGKSEAGEALLLD